MQNVGSAINNYTVCRYGAHLGRSSASQAIPLLGGCIGRYRVVLGTRNVDFYCASQVTVIVSR